MKIFFEWHNKLTGSCKLGRETFAKDHNVDINGHMTTAEFIDLTINAYGGDTIRRLKAKYI